MAAVKSTLAPTEDVVDGGETINPTTEFEPESAPQLTRKERENKVSRARALIAAC
jgi:hypothetical protein